jgi:diguanylate cyclase (GGDEF)-like protein
VAVGDAVPGILSSNFIIDLPTLCAVTVFIAATGGLMLLFSWAQDRATPALALWGGGYLLGAAGAALLALRGFIPDVWSIFVANALMCVAYGVMWSGARSFEGRRIRPSWTLAGAVIWVAACQVEGFYDSNPARTALVSAILAGYALLGARELWHARDRELISRWPTLVLVLIHAGFLLARVALASALPYPVGTGQPHGIGFLVMAFEALFVAFCLAFLRVAMAKERAELRQRRAALVDPLTGVANRRAFFDHGYPLLERAIAERRPAALLLFDLDRFKQINDTAGHQAGDHLLKAFADVAAASMRSGDLFGRLGGEEFACLSVNTSMTHALQAAERVREAFEKIDFQGAPEPATVSVGVAMAGDADENLHALLAAADCALYRAKAKGRNRVELARAPLALVPALEPTPEVVFDGAICSS